MMKLNSKRGSAVRSACGKRLPKQRSK
jgi:hypothetical protein